MKRFESYHDKLSRLFGGVLASNVTFQLTEDCNLACSYCYQTNKSKEKMNFEIAKKFVDMFLGNEKNIERYLPLENTNGYIFEFIGGEPFLEVKLMDEICTYILKRMIALNHPLLAKTRFSISTNGTLYFEAEVQSFLKKFKGFVSLSISIDGDRTLHDSCRKYPNGQGSYDVAIKGARDYMAKGNVLGNKMTLCPSNVDNVYCACKSLLEEGYEDIHLNCVYEEGWELGDAKILYLQLKELADYLIEKKLDVSISMFNDRQFAKLRCTDSENWCGGNGQMIAVDPRGDIFPCIRYMKSSLGKSRAPLCIGNVESGVLSTKEQCEINNCLKCITRQSQSTKECIECPVASGCSWCTAYNYQMTGDPNKRMTYICKMHKATSLANVYYWNKQGVPFKMNLPKEDVIEIVGEEEYVRLKILDTSAQTKKHKVEKLN